MNNSAFYNILFREINEKYGAFDESTLTGVIGFNGGGPVSLLTILDRNVFATCELALNEKQQPSSDGLRFEFISFNLGDSNWCQSIFTTLGEYSLENILGDGHTIDLSGLEQSGPSIIRLSLLCQVEIEAENFGVYLVSEA